MGNPGWDLKPARGCPTKASERTRRWGESLWTADLQLMPWRWSDQTRVILFPLSVWLWLVHCAAGNVSFFSVCCVTLASFRLPLLNPGLSLWLHSCVLLFFPRQKETKAGGWFCRRIWRGEKESYLFWGVLRKTIICVSWAVFLCWLDFTWWIFGRGGKRASVPSSVRFCKASVMGSGRQAHVEMLASRFWASWMEGGKIWLNDTETKRREKTQMRRWRSARRKWVIHCLCSFFHSVLSSLVLDGFSIVSFLLPHVSAVFVKGQKKKKNPQQINFLELSKFLCSSGHMSTSPLPKSLVPSWLFVSWLQKQMGKEFLNSGWWIASSP